MHQARCRFSFLFSRHVCVERPVVFRGNRHRFGACHGSVQSWGGGRPSPSIRGRPRFRSVLGEGAPQSLHSWPVTVPSSFVARPLRNYFDSSGWRVSRRQKCQKFGVFTAPPVALKSLPPAAAKICRVGSQLQYAKELVLKIAAAGKLHLII